MALERRGMWDVGWGRRWEMGMVGGMGGMGMWVWGDFGMRLGEKKGKREVVEEEGRERGGLEGEEVVWGKRKDGFFFFLMGFRGGKQGWGGGK